MIRNITDNKNSCFTLLSIAMIIFMITTNVSAQNYPTQRNTVVSEINTQVNGKVTDIKGVALNGVNILIKGTS